MYQCVYIAMRIAHADGAHGATVRNCTVSRSQKNNTWFAKTLQYVVSTFEFFLVLSLLSWLLQWTDLFTISLPEWLAVSCVQHSFLHLTPPIPTLWRPSCTVLPILHHQETLSPQLLTPSTCTFQWCLSANWHSKHEHKLTFLSVTATYIRTYVRPENRSLIQSLALMRLAIMNSCQE